jgi:hypothetical protein
MRLWELLSIVGDPQTLHKVAGTRRDWEYIGQLIEDLEQLVKERDRAKLDYGLPREFVRACLHMDSQMLFLSRQRKLSSLRRSFWDKKLSALKAFDRFGVRAVYEAFEYGSHTLPSE